MVSHEAGDKLASRTTVKMSRIYLQYVEEYVGYILIMFELGAT